VLIVCLLDSFYTQDARHHGRLAPPLWVPSDSSVSSRNLRKMVPEGSELLCFNSCPYIVASANHHGTPDPLYVARILRLLGAFDVLLVCGAVAKSTFRLSPYKGSQPNLFIHHPAWRAWSLVEFSRVRERILTLTVSRSVQ